MLEDALYWTIAAIVGGIVVASFVRQRRAEHRRVSRLARMPLRKAVVVRVEDGASRTRDWRELRCTLRFMAGESAEATASIQVPIMRLSMVHPGAPLMVRLSDDGSNEAVVEWMASEALALVAAEETR